MIQSTSPECRTTPLYYHSHWLSTSDLLAGQSVQEVTPVVEHVLDAHWKVLSKKICL
jgi:hypothetical protein